MLSTGDIIDGKYRILRLIGEGGMGAVYEGENTRIHRRVAIKVLHPGQATHAETVARFEREAQAAGRIGSDHIVEVLDLGSLPSGERYMVMEFLEGESLSSRIRARQRLSPEETASIAIQLLEALVAAHGAGIVHRDLKPDNVFLLRSNRGQRDFVKLLDFGISKFNQLSGDSASGFSMTRTGAVMGTPYYMAPEQAKGARDVDHRVDIYASGVILYECVTGDVPFKADTFNQLLFKIALEQPRPIQELVPGLDPGFIAIVNQAMARDPVDRYPTALALQQALSDWLARRGGAVAVASAASAPAVVNQPAVVAAIPPTGSYGPSEAIGGAKTAGNWANTQSGAKSRNNGRIALIAAAGIGLLVVGGIAFALLPGGGSAPTDGVASAASSAHGVPVSHAASPPAPAESVAATPEVTPAAQPSSNAEVTTAAESASPPAPSASEAPSAVAPVAARVPARPVQRAPVKGKEASGSGAKPASTTPPATPTQPSGRKIRTTL